MRNETFNVVMSAGMGIQQRDKIGFEIQCINGDTRAVTAHLTDTLGSVNGYDERSTKCLIEAFQMNNKLSDYFSSKMKYDSQVISGVMGLKNAADLMYDVSQGPRCHSTAMDAKYEIFW